MPAEGALSVSAPEATLSLPSPADFGRMLAEGVLSLSELEGAFALSSPLSPSLFLISDANVG